MKQIRILMAALTLAFSFQVKAGNDGHGGNGITFKGKLYLFDFFEAGIEGQEFVNTGIANEMGIGDRLRKHILSGDATALNLTINKLNEIYKVAPEFALRLHEYFLNYEWRFLAPELFKVRDIGFTPILNNGNLPVISLAVRDDESKIVYIDKERWKTLDAKNRSGLLFHEILYALYIREGNRSEFERPDSYEARVFNGLLFHPTFEQIDHERFIERLGKLSKPKDYLDYDSYNLTISQDYKHQCDEFEAKTDLSLKIHLERVSQSTTKMIRFKINNNYNFTGAYRATQKANFENVTYDIPSNENLGCLNCGYKGRFSLRNPILFNGEIEYNFSNDDARIFAEAIAFSKSILNIENDQYLRRCLAKRQPATIGTLRLLAEINLVDDRINVPVVPPPPVENGKSKKKKGKDYL
jgi:hypothetical protein